MELYSEYFHSVHPYKEKERTKQLKEILYKLECILKAGYILPYRNIKRLHPDISRHSNGGLNGETRISVSLHEDNVQPRDILFKKVHFGDVGNAFNMFALVEPSIVLSSSLKDYNLIRKGMFLERQILGPVSLEYMDAISILPVGEISPFFGETRELQEDYIKRHNLIVDNKLYDKEFLLKIRLLLDKYEYKDIPIVSIMSGNEFTEGSSIK